MKVLFLDHNGVICLRAQWGMRLNKKSIKRGEVFDPFCTKAIKTLNKIIEETDCEIVISSDWRLYKDLNYMQKLYKDRGIIKSPISYTEVFDIDDNDIFESTREYKDSNQMMARVREKEIKAWLASNSYVTSWVAVDDLPLKKLERFVHTTKIDEGIKQTGIKEKIIELLQNDRHQNEI